jgi:hypothetical protein
MADIGQTVQRARRQRLGVATVLIACGVAVGVMLTAKPGDTRFGVAAGVLGALIASFVSLCFTLFVLDENPTDAARAADRLNVSLEALHSAVSIAEQSKRFGIDAIKPKSSYAADEWMTVLTSAREKLLLVGHALDTWCVEDFLPTFIDTLIRLASDGASVQMLTLPAEGANTQTLGQQRGQDYGQRVKITHGFVATARSQLSATHRQYLDVRVLEPDVPMPYMVVANEHLLITCAYPTTGKSSNTMLATRMSSVSAPGRAIRDDINRLFQEYATPVDLDAAGA